MTSTPLLASGWQLPAALGNLNDSLIAMRGAQTKSADAENLLICAIFLKQNLLILFTSLYLMTLILQLHLLIL